MKRILLFLGICLFLGSYAPLCIAASATPKKDIPTNIKADKMDYSANKQLVTFTGNVFVKRPDFTLTAATLTVYLKKSDKKQDDDALGGMQAGDIDKIVAQKNVVMKSQNKEGKCQTATFYAATNKFVMEGSPVLIDKENTIKGQKIIHYMDTNRSEVAGGVEANFLAPDNSSAGPIIPTGKKTKE